MKARGRRRALAAFSLPALLLALAAGATPPTGAATSTAASGPRIALATAWGPTFWEALRNGAPISFTPQGDALVVAPGIGSNQQVIEELAPDGSVLWQTGAYQLIHSVVSFDGGARFAFLALPMPAARPYHLVLGIVDPTTGTVLEAPIDYRAGGGLIPAGDDVVVDGGWSRSDFAAVFDTSAQLVSSIALPGYPTIAATAHGAAILATQGLTTTVWAVNGVSGAITRVGTLPTPSVGGTYFRVLPTGAVLAYTGVYERTGTDLTAWEPPNGDRAAFSQAWTWPASLTVAAASGGYGAIAPSGALAALPVADGVAVVGMNNGDILAKAAATGYVLRVEGAMPDGFVVLEVPSGIAAGQPRPDRLATFTWQGTQTETVTLPASEDGAEEAVYAATALVDGLYLTATSTVDDVVAVSSESAAASLPAALPPALETAPMTLGETPPKVAALEVVADGQVVDAAHPLVLSAAEVNRPIPVEVLLLDNQGANVPAPTSLGFVLSDGGGGGTFLPTPDWGTPAGALGASVTYQNAKAGSYVLTATLNGQVTAPPLFSIARSVLAGASLAVTVDPPPGTVRTDGTVVITPVVGSDLASLAPVTATAQSGGTYVASFVAGSGTGAAAFEATVPGRKIDLGESPMVNVANLASPAEGTQYTGSDLRLTLWSDAPGDTPIGFVVTPAGKGPPILAAYLGAPAVVLVPGHAPISATVAAVDADGAQTTPLGGGVG